MKGDVVELRPRRRAPPHQSGRPTPEQEGAAELTRRRRSFWAVSIIVLSTLATLLLVRPALQTTDMRMAYLFLWSCSAVGLIGSALIHARAKRRLRASGSVGHAAGRP
jgi:hypothetical protein